MHGDGDTEESRTATVAARSNVIPRIVAPASIAPGDRVAFEALRINPAPGRALKRIDPCSRRIQYSITGRASTRHAIRKASSRRPQPIEALVDLRLGCPLVNQLREYQVPAPSNCPTSRQGDLCGST
jgi:hypothetical protein